MLPTVARRVYGHQWVNDHITLRNCFGSQADLSHTWPLVHWNAVFEVAFREPIRLGIKRRRDWNMSRAIEMVTGYRVTREPVDVVGRFKGVDDVLKTIRPVYRGVPRYGAYYYVRDLREWQIFERHHKLTAAYHQGGETYVIADYTGQLVKIGKSRDVERRLADLRNSNAHPLELLGTVAEFEAVLHQRFARYRAHGEWFTVKGRLKMWLQETFPDQLSRVA